MTLTLDCPLNLFAWARQRVGPPYIQSMQTVVFSCERDVPRVAFCACDPRRSQTRKSGFGCVLKRTNIAELHIDQLY